MCLNEVEKNQTVFSLCLEALKRMNEEIILTNNKMHIQVYKEPEILIYTLDKVFDVLDNNDSISIILNENIKFHAPSHSHDFVNETETSTLYTENDERPTIFVDGNDLCIKDLVRLGTGKFKINLTEQTWNLIKTSRQVVNDLISEHKCIYGINTGFGKFASTVIPDTQLEELQINLIRSHSAGIGDYLSTKYVRMLMALRINVLAKGFSGISPESLECVLKAFNKSCLPLVPEQGTVGASGDLAPLSHIVLGLLGEGKMWSPSTGLEDASKVLLKHGLTPISLKPKEGLALINGTQMITALGADAIERAINLALQADIISALTVEMLKGNVDQFDAEIHKARPHPGQIEVASRIRSLLHSDVYESKCYIGNVKDRKVQDPYTMRCIPQIHGIVVDTINFCKRIIETEMNSATDNPMVLKDRNEMISGGNFHGEYPAKALDYLAIGVHELANVSERRIERLVNCAYSEGLPSFLVGDGGINSGFMIAHCTAAALTSENKVLCHPSSSDTISTSGGTEDHVSMGGWSARKALKVIGNVENILAIELLAGCQALEFFHANGFTTTKPLEAVYNLVRKHIQPWKKDRYMSPDIELATNLIQNNKIWQVAKGFITTYKATKCVDPSLSMLLE